MSHESVQTQMLRDARAEVERLKGGLEAACRQLDIDTETIAGLQAKLQTVDSDYAAVILPLKTEIARLQGELAEAKRTAIYALDVAGGRLLTLDNMQHPDIPSNRDVLDIVKNTMNALAKDSQTQKEDSHG